jgi:hypothetical protein
MNLYYPLPDSDTYDCLNAVNSEYFKLLMYFMGYPAYQHYEGMPSSWKPIPVEIERREKSGHFPSLSGHPLVVSEEARKILQPLIGGSVQFLPLICSSGNYAVLKVVDVVDCLDYTRAVVSRFRSSGRVMSIKSYAFKEGCIGDRAIFQLPELNTVLVSQRFKDCVDANGLEGLIFRQVA